MVAAAEDKAEILLGMTDNTSLEDPDVCIANSSVTVHMTPYKRGIIDMK
jgi:hypothetical protein